jgi:DNA-binding CsgD family transcriptional regulator
LPNQSSCGAEQVGLFTGRQRQVIEALRQGKPNKIIAYELNMCESTVKVHVRTIMKKLKARNRTQVAYLYSSSVERDREPDLIGDEDLVENTPEASSCSGRIVALRTGFQ